MSLTMITSNVAGSTKKQLTAAILFVGYCVGNIIGPQTFLDSEARKFSASKSLHQLIEAARYHSAYIAMLVGYSVKLAAVIVLYLYMFRQNKARDAAGDVDERTAIDNGMHDMTEIDNKGFRYSL